MDKKCFSTAIYSVLLHVCVDGTTYCFCWYSVSAPIYIVSDLVSCFLVMYDNLKSCLCVFISSLNESGQSLSLALSMAVAYHIHALVHNVNFELLRVQVELITFIEGLMT